MRDSNRTRILVDARRDRRHLIDILQDVQKYEGYLSRESMIAVARFLNVPPITVWSVATFYNQFCLTPPGRNPIRVCMGTACHLAGGQLVLEAVVRELKLDIGATSDDGEYSLARVACLGCCALAPVMTIGDQIYPRMSPPAVEEVLVRIHPADKGDKA